MDCNDKDAKTRPLISSLKPQREEIEERVLVIEEEEEDDESARLLPPRIAEISNESPKSSRKVRWNDINGNKLAQIMEFEPSEVSDSDDDDSDSCFCTIM